jgi:hypothetical protein
MSVESNVRGLLLREVIVDVFGNLLPGTLVVGVSVAIVGWPIVTFTEIARLTAPDASLLEVGLVSSLLTALERFTLPLGFLFVIAAYVLGHLFYRQDIKVPDKRSFLRIQRSVAVDPWVARSTDECEFPYLNLRGYLEARGLLELAAMVPWQAPSPQLELGVRAVGSPPPTFVQRTKTFVNSLKLRILTHRPASFGPIARNEAHVRLNSSTWYMARAVEWMSYGTLIGALLLTWYLWTIQLQSSASQRLVWVPLLAPALGIMVARWIRWKIENVLHYQRVREVIHVLETAHILFRHEPEIIADLCPGTSLWAKATS